MTGRIRYVCSECGHEESGWTGKCSACGAWGTMEEVMVDRSRAKGQAKGSDRRGGVQPTPLFQVSVKEDQRLDTGMQELNRVLGGGLVKDSVTMLTAKPGAGKSTLLLQLLGAFAERDIPCLYVSGEESASQVKNRALRILPHIGEKLYLLSGNSMEDVMAAVRKLHPQVLVMDSIQTLALEELPQRQGSPTQTVQVTAETVDLCKDPAHPMAAFLVGHMTKGDEMAGLRTLEHLVDTVLYLEAGEEESLRILRSSKNRFGYTGEVGLFQMGERGLTQVTDPYGLFISGRRNQVPGSAISLQKQGSRYIPIEIEALVSPCYENYPTRIGDSMRRDELNTLVAILQQKAGYPMYRSNVVIKVTGGLAIREKCCDLAVVMSIASSHDQFSLSAKDAFLAEVGLTGELKPVREEERRIRELARMGFERVFLGGRGKESTQEGIRVYRPESLPALLALMKTKK